MVLNKEPFCSHLTIIADSKIFLTLEWQLEEYIEAHVHNVITTVPV